MSFHAAISRTSAVSGSMHSCLKAANKCHTSPDGTAISQKCWRLTSVTGAAAAVCNCELLQRNTDGVEVHGTECLSDVFMVPAVLIAVMG